MLRQGAALPPFLWPKCSRALRCVYTVCKGFLAPGYTVLTRRIAGRIPTATACFVNCTSTVPQCGFRWKCSKNVQDAAIYYLPHHPAPKARIGDRRHISSHGSCVSLEWMQLVLPTQAGSRRLASSRAGQSLEVAPAVLPEGEGSQRSTCQRGATRSPSRSGLCLKS